LCFQGRLTDDETIRSGAGYLSQRINIISVLPDKIDENHYDVVRYKNLSKNHCYESKIFISIATTRFGSLKKQEDEI
jgi:hypothetical protein